MAQLLVELCTILVEEHLGERIASLWQHLADVGRTSFKDLLATSSIPEDELTKLLSILILHNCVNYYTDEEYAVAYYTVDLEGAYNILRLSRLIDVARKRCGSDAAGVLANIAQFGHVSIGDLTTSYELGTNMSGVAANTTNGSTTASNTRPPDSSRPSTSIKTVEQLHAALLALLRAGFLVKAQPRFTQNAYDLEQQLEQQVIEEEFAGQRVTGPVSSRRFRDAVNSRKRKQQEEDFANEELAQYGTDMSLPPHKRRKLAGRMTNGHSGPELDDGLVLYINSKKYLIALRSERLETLATEALGTTAGSIYGALLRTLEKQIHDLRREPNNVLNYDSDDDDEEAPGSIPSPTTALPKTTAMEIISALPSNIDYMGSMNVSEKAVPKQAVNGHRVTRVNVIEDEDFSGIGIKPEPVSDDDNDDDGHDDDFLDRSNRAKTLDLLHSHLELLAEHSSSFCSKTANKNPPEWQVDFSHLTEQILLAEVDMTVSARFGTTTTRLVRLLREKGKLEEKQISSFSFLPLRTIRALLTEVFASGFVDAQELAKDNTRQPSKALYLWYFDFKKVKSAMLEQCYLAICRLYQRMAVERRRYATIIQKAEDVVRDRLIERRATSLHGADHEAHLDVYINGIYDDASDSGEANGTGVGANETGEHTNGVEASGEEPDTNESAAADGEATGNDAHNTGQQSSQALGGDDETEHEPSADHTPRVKDKKLAAGDLLDAGLINEITNDERLRGCSKFVMSTENLSKDIPLSNYEKQKYREWRNYESLFLGHIMRIDDLVLLLRDF